MVEIENIKRQVAHGAVVCAWYWWEPDGTKRVAWDSLCSHGEGVPHPIRQPETMEGLLRDLDRALWQRGLTLLEGWFAPTGYWLRAYNRQGELVVLEEGELPPI